MRQHLLLVTACSIIVGCFGPGPDPGPTADDKAVPLASVPSTDSGSGSSRPWFGAASPGENDLYVAVENVGAAGAPGGSEIWAVHKDGSGHSVIASLPSDRGLRLAQDADALYWIAGAHYDSPDRLSSSCDVNRIEKKPLAKSVSIGAVAATGPCAALSLVVDDLAVWLVTGTAGGSDGGSSGTVGAPDPCCDLNSSIGGNFSTVNAAALTRIGKLPPKVGTSVPININCGDMKACMQGGAEALYFFGAPEPGTAPPGTPSIIGKRFAKADGVTTPLLADGVLRQNVVTGFAVFNGKVTASLYNGDQRSCTIVRGDTTGGGSTTLQKIAARLCRDVVADDTNIYFTLFERQPDDGKGGSPSESFVGTGIGHVTTTATIDTQMGLLPIARRDVAVRRLVLGPVNLFLIDPFRLTSIPRAIVP